MFFIKCKQNHRAPAISYNCYKVYKDDIEFKTKNKQKTQKEQKLALFQNNRQKIKTCICTY